MFDAILFDLLSALIDSWSLWDDIAGSREAGRRWRMRYLAITYETGAYLPYEDLVARSAVDSGLASTSADELVARWLELQPWPEANGVLSELAESRPLGVVTNCSLELGRAAASLLGVPFRTVVTAEEVGWYKPLARPYEAALEGLGSTPGRTMFVAGSPGDIGGASAVGMPVVWHNRPGLELPPGAAKPWRTIPDLGSLADVLE
jgi:2-haloalkanoic acid dehalogenase type II